MIFKKSLSKFFIVHNPAKPVLLGTTTSSAAGLVSVAIASTFALLDEEDDEEDDDSEPSGSTNVLGSAVGAVDIGVMAIPARPDSLASGVLDAMVMPTADELASGVAENVIA